MKRLKKVLISSAAAVIAFLPFTFPVHAESEPRGSITVKISEPLQGRTFRVYQVENGSGGLTEPFKGLPEYLYGTTTDVLQEKDADTANAIQAYIDNNPKVDFHSVYAVYSDTEEFTGLSEGLYLVMQTEAPKGYERIESFLVDMPHTVDNSHLTYSVECNPKTEAASPEATTQPEVVKPTVAPEKEKPKYGEDAQSGMGMSEAMHSIMVSGIMLVAGFGLLVVSIALFKAYKAELKKDSEEEFDEKKKKK